VCHKAFNAFRFARMYVGPDRGIPFLSSSDIIGFRPERGKFLSLKTERIEDLRIQPWEVLLSCSGTIGNVSLASPRISGWAVSQHVIRITAPDRYTAGYVAVFLRSQWGRPQLTGMVYGSVVQHIEPVHLQQVVIPDLPPVRRGAIGRAFVDAALKRDEANDKLDAADSLISFELRLPPMPAHGRGPVISHIKASNWAGRLEAAFHNPIARWVEQQLQTCGLVVLPLSNDRLTHAINAVTKFRKRIYIPKGGIPLLSSKQLFQIDPVELKGLARGAHLNDMEEIGLKANMVMVTCSGTNGRVQIVPTYMNDWGASQDALRVIAADDSWAGFIFAWLASPYGQALLSRHQYGSVVTHLDRDMVGSIPVPIISETGRQGVATLVLNANRLRNEAWTLEQAALRELRTDFTPAAPPFSPA
jgi:type I restriction enzyme, S subunit